MQQSENAVPNEKPAQVTTEMDFDIQAFAQNLPEKIESAADQILSITSLYQIAAIIVAVTLGWVLSRKPKAKLNCKSGGREHYDVVARLYHSLGAVLWPLFSVVFIWIGVGTFSLANLPHEGLRIAASLANAAIVVRLITSNMQEGPGRTLLAWLAWFIAALYILHLLDPAVGMLESTAIRWGDTRISALQVITSVLVAGIALWFGRFAGDAAQTSLRESPRLTPSMAGLLGQVAKIGFMVVAVMIALNVVGFNLGALAVLGGAVGVGIGFGLQSIFSNFISGIIILFEKSIKVGDFIELASGVTGQVKEINIRATLVNTNDDVDILVPNEEFIKAQVINWTLRDSRRRLRVSFGVAYGTKKETVKQAALEAAEAVEWTDSSTKGREPKVWLVEFGDSSLNYELVVWLTDAAVRAPAKVKAHYNWALHSALEKYDLEIPFPQRDLNIRQPAEITVRMAKGAVKAEKPKRVDESIVITQE